LLGAKRITIINVVHFFKKRCLAAFTVRSLIVLTKFSVRTVSRFSVFLGWSQYHCLGKRFSKVSYECKASVECTYPLEHFGSKCLFTRP